MPLVELAGNNDIYGRSIQAADPWDLRVPSMGYVHRLGRGCHPVIPHPRWGIGCVVHSRRLAGKGRNDSTNWTAKSRDLVK